MFPGAVNLAEPSLHAWALGVSGPSRMAAAPQAGCWPGVLIWSFAPPGLWVWYAGLMSSRRGWYAGLAPLAWYTGLAQRPAVPGRPRRGPGTLDWRRAPLGPSARGAGPARCAAASLHLAAPANPLSSAGPSLRSAPLRY